MNNPGQLYVVATPLGNLDDLSPRALRVLGEVDVVACEDTRHTGRLLRHFGVSARLVSLHAHNESSRAESLVAQLLEGRSVAVVSDAGTPCVSDPGEQLVAACVAAGVRVVPVPGPSAVIAALSASGLATGAFHFGGFLTRSRGKRREALAQLGSRDSTLILYESPRRLVGLLEDVIEALGGERRVVVARELTKVHEELVRGSAVEVCDVFSGREQVLGEVTVLVEGGGTVVGDAGVEGDEQTIAPAVLAASLARQGMSTRSMRDVLVEVLSMSRNEAYRVALEASGDD